MLLKTEFTKCYYAMSFFNLLTHNANIFVFHGLFIQFLFLVNAQHAVEEMQHLKI